MQYHHNGFNSGDPAISKSSTTHNANSKNVDVLIVGCGPAGLTLATQLCQFPELNIRIVEAKPGPLEVGQADGLACRSLEMFQAFGFAEKVLKESYYVNEVAFWRPDSTGKEIHRADLIQDVEDDLSEMPHVILNQARVHDFYLQQMLNSAHRLTPDYNHKLIELTQTDNNEYPISATFQCSDNENLNATVADTETETINARYVVGCDGARSTVRRFIGQELKGSSARQLWGVMDILAVTDFPDIRKKAAIQSANDGSILIIPREGGYMARMYIELDELHGNERAADKNVTPESLIEKASAILSPYKLDVKQVVWWSAYEIGQRVCDAFDNASNIQNELRVPNVFIAGDACHTHSPKAGQGMNVGMADSFNLGWKLAAVLQGQAKPELLNTYSTERQEKARELIEFDKDMARLFSEKTKDTESAKQFQQYFKKHGRYTAGVETQYAASLITHDKRHQSLAEGLIVGKRFHSEQAVRLSDAKPMQLGHTITADGRWRLMIFADQTDTDMPSQAVTELCDFLATHKNSPVVKFTKKNNAMDSVIDVRAIFQSSHQSLAIETMPPLLLPKKGAYELIDYEKIFTTDTRHSADIFDSRGINRSSGALVIVRPDQYVASVLALNDYDSIAQFFDQFMNPA